MHRGAETSFDVSADLPELARSQVAVVCAGPKAILDLGLTREFLGPGVCRSLAINAKRIKLREPVPDYYITGSGAKLLLEQGSVSEVDIDAYKNPVDRISE